MSEKEITDKHIHELALLINDCDKLIDSLIVGNEYWSIPFINGIKTVKKKIIKYKESLTNTQ